MFCPRCEGEVLEERVRDGVTVDICHGCRGIWLDRGELERLLARAGRADEERSAERRGGGFRAADDDRRDRRRDDDDRRDRRRDDDDRRDRRRDDDDDDDGPRGGFFGALRNLFD